MSPRRKDLADKDEILETLHDAVLEGNAEKAKQIAERSPEAKISPLVAIEEGLPVGIREVGDLFSRMETYLPEMVLSAKAMETVVAVLEPNLGEEAREKKGTVLIGTVKGDIHDIGENIAIALLKINGYEVIDLGKDVASTDFIDEANRINAQIIGH